MAHDYIVANLRCENCGVICDADESSDMQTTISVKKGYIPYGIGNYIEVMQLPLEDWGYVCIEKPDVFNTFNLIETWSCQNCGNFFNWAMIEIEKGKIKSIQEISLNEENLKKANYVNDVCEPLGWTIKDGKFFYTVPSAADRPKNDA